jgi:transposase
MSTIAHSHRFVVGVDTHARNHVYAIATATGEIIDTRSFPTSRAGMSRALAWVTRRTDGNHQILWVIEGAASYGARLTATLIDDGHQVAEAPQIGRHLAHGTGKSDQLDARRIAVSVLGVDNNQLRRPRQADGTRGALRVLLAARESMTGERTRHVNALVALLRIQDLDVDARRVPSTAQIRQISRWRARRDEVTVSVARDEAVRLATRILEIDQQLADNQRRLAELVSDSQAAPLLEMVGVGPVSAAVCLTIWSHPGRVRSEAAFASLAGVNPIPASSGNTVRHRLNLGGDRKLNRALHMIAISRMTHDQETRDYVAKRRSEGLTTKEIRRCVKRYLARRIYRILENQSEVPTAA